MAVDEALRGAEDGWALSGCDLSPAEGISQLVEIQDVVAISAGRYQEVHVEVMDDKSSVGEFDLDQVDVPLTFYRALEHDGPGQLDALIKCLIAADPAVDQFADDVGVAGVLVSLGDHPDQQDAKRCLPAAVGPVRDVAWGVQVELGDSEVGMRTGLPVDACDVVARLIRCGPSVDLGVWVVPKPSRLLDRWAAERRTEVAVLQACQVLDYAEEAKSRSPGMLSSNCGTRDRLRRVRTVRGPAVARPRRARRT